jgi:cysteine desulfurase
MSLYFDYAATAPVNAEILDNILSDYNTDVLFGNPSSTHTNGILAREILEQARIDISELLGCQANEIFFTSGGTESDNMALKGIMLKYKVSPYYHFENNAQLITSTIEHPAILNTCKELEKLGYTIHYVKPDENGIINPKDVERLINPATKLISIMAINNEIGTIEPINEIAKIAHDHNVLFHSDMVQGVGLYNIDLSNVDLASFSGHKFGAIKGTGILYKKTGIDIEPILKGGGQENGLRSGTENVLGALDMADCLRYTIDKWNSKNKYELRENFNALVNKLYAEFGDRVYKISNDFGEPNLLSIGFAGIDSRTLQLLLSEEEDICVSVGSACHSNSEDISHVIKAINVPKKYQNGVIRITATPDTTEQSILILGTAISKQLRKMYEGE